MKLGCAALRARMGTWTDPAFLGGAPHLGNPGRWSILAARPRGGFVADSGLGYHSWGLLEDTQGEGDALDALGDLLNRLQLGSTAGHPDLDPALPFQGGLIGYLAYDLAPRIEAIPQSFPGSSPIPALRFGLYDTFVLVDHQRDRAKLWGLDLLGEGSKALTDRLDQWTADLARPLVESVLVPSSGRVVADQSRGEYLARVARAIEYIRAGDIFQVNLSQRFTAETRGDPLEIDARLRSTSPAPYSAFLRWGDYAILSASPELFFETEGHRIVTRPIKGTRPRRADPEEDLAMRAALIASAKDEAELTMIVDLERNDLGRVCDFGSVQVVEARAIESFRTVHHTVATVEGRLRAGVGPIDVIRALFPGGSITGAPKIRAMEIIDELEPCGRGVYTGSIGYWSANGRSAFNIAIRTIVCDHGRATYHVGGGIVADSDPEQEYQETLDKGRALFEALDPTRSQS